MRIIDLSEPQTRPRRRFRHWRRGRHVPNAFTVYMVVVGSFDQYLVMDLFEDRPTAWHYATEYNQVFASNGDDIECYARVEEMLFYPSGVLPPHDFS